jgi:hypothetical protein
MTAAKATKKGNSALSHILRTVQKLRVVFRTISLEYLQMKTQLLVAWFIALGSIAAAEVQAAIREHARGHICDGPQVNAGVRDDADQLASA